MTAQATPSSGRAPPASLAPPAAQVPRRAPRRPPPRRSRFLALLAYTGIAILFLAVAATTFLLVAPPVDVVRERLITEFQARTGYLLEINGATSLRLQPAPSIEFRDVVVATAGENGSPVLRAEAIEVEPRLVGLFWGRVQVERIVVRRPQLDLVVDAEGRRKWQRADHDDGAPQRVRVAQVRADETPGRFSMPALREGSGPPIIRDDTGPPPKAAREEPAPRSASAPGREPWALQVPAIRIADGIVRYRDLRAGTLLQSDQIQLRVSQRSGKDLALQARGSFAYGGETVKLEIGADTPADRRARGLERIVVRLDGRHGQVRYDGAISLADRPILAGAVDVMTPSARDAVRWFGKTLMREGGVVGPVAFKGRIDSREGRTTVEQMDLTLEGVRVGGQVAVDHAGARPRFTADLDFADLDFDRVRETIDPRQSTRGSGRRGAPKEGGGDVVRPERAARLARAPHARAAHTRATCAGACRARTRTGGDRRRRQRSGGPCRQCAETADVAHRPHRLHDARWRRWRGAPESVARCVARRDAD